MFRKALLAATAASMVAIPGVASAQYYPAPTPYYGGYNNGYYNNGYGGYDARDQRRYERQQRRYERQQRRYSNRYDGYDGYHGQRCSGTTGAIIGGVAGALLGRQVTRGGRNSYYGYRRGGNGTTGAIVGGAVGALVGNEVGKSSCRR